MKKVAAVVITYHPDLEDLHRNIEAFIDYVDVLIIWRNSTVEINIPIEYESKVQFMGNGENEYIALPLNKIIDWCVSNNYDYLLTMDQDSKWIHCASFIQKILSWDESDVAIYAPNVNNRYDSTVSYRDVESVITSGGMLNVQIAKKLGGFREDYKIYWIDGEFCYWARLHGYKIRILVDCEMKQQFGKQTRTIGGFYASNYSPIVYYFLFRNMLWMRREFKDGVSLKCIAYTSLYNIRGIILGEKNKIKKILMIFRAFVAGLFYSVNKRNRKNGEELSI